MTRASARHPDALDPKKAKTRRANEAARRAQRRRHRVIGWATAGAVVALVVILVALAISGRRGTTKAIAVGASAPDGSFTTVLGNTYTVASLRGHPTLLWFVATWCSSCQAGTESMASHIGDFAGHDVRVVELEMANDLGQPGPSISSFGAQLAGAAFTNPDWTWGKASRKLTTTYDPASYLDVYYLLDSAGHIAYVNSSPASTMGQLLSHIATVGTST